MPFPEPTSCDNADNVNDESLKFENDNPKLTAHEVAELFSFFVKLRKSLLPLLHN